MLERRHLIANVLALGLFSVFSRQGWAKTFDQEDLASLSEIEQYLQRIKSASARFIQIGPKGELSRGRFYLRRPGRLRFEYDPPNPLLIVADGFWLVLHDRELDSVERFPLYRTPLGILVAEKVDLQSDVQVMRLERKLGLLRIQLRERNPEAEGWMSVLFSLPPITLRQWEISDSLGGLTSVTLTDMDTNVNLDPELFVSSDTIGRGDEPR